MNKNLKEILYYVIFILGNLFLIIGVFLAMQFKYPHFVLAGTIFFCLGVVFLITSNTINLSIKKHEIVTAKVFKN